jgi:hypothetical protein
MILTFQQKMIRWLLQIIQKVLINLITIVIIGGILYFFVFKNFLF